MWYEDIIVFFQTPSYRIDKFLPLFYKLCVMTVSEQFSTRCNVLLYLATFFPYSLRTTIYTPFCNNLELSNTLLDVRFPGSDKSYLQDSV